MTQTGFKYGKNRVRVIREIKRLPWEGREYRVLLVETDGRPYVSLRLYNARRHFIKQFLMEPGAAAALGIIKPEDLNVSTQT